MIVSANYAEDDAAIAELEARFRAANESPADRLARFQVDHHSTCEMSWEEIDRLRPPFVVDGFIRRGELMLLGAESKSRKSWLVQDLALCVAGGIPWLQTEDGEGGFETAPGHVWALDLELNGSEVAYRFAKARNNRFQDHRTRETVTDRVTAYSLDGQPAAEVMAMLEELRPMIAPGDLVIVDCLYRLEPDGNEATLIASVMETLKRFAGDTEAALVLVDHFRKAGDDKARNRFAGSFVKQASAATLVAIEVDPTGILTLNVDARTFHGTPKTHCRFNCETYAFDGVLECDVAAVKESRQAAELQGWVAAAWRGRDKAERLDARALSAAWGLCSKAAGDRAKKLEEGGSPLLTRIPPPPGGANRWTLTPAGIAAIDRLKA